MMLYYLINTIVAIAIGLALANLIRPGVGAELVEPRRPPPPAARRGKSVGTTCSTS